MAIVLNGTTGISSPGGDVSVSQDLSGNLNFTGTGNRIRGDFSNATAASRVAVQTSTTNGTTALNIIPNGTGVVSSLIAFSDSTLTNASFGQLRTEASVDVRFNSSFLGSGTYLPMTFYTGGSERLRLDTSGNLGLGVTPSGTYKLEVSGKGLFRGFNGSIIAFDRTDTTVAGVIGHNDVQSSLYIGTTTNHPFAFYTNNTERARITSDGSLLVGVTTNSGGSRLRVRSAGNTFATNCVVFENSSSTNVGYIRDDGAWNSGAGAGSPYNLTTGSAANLFVASDGFLYRSTSSLKYKTDVQNATHGLAEVMQLRPVTYKGKSESDGDKVFGGLIAEEVHEAGLTEFVQYAEDGTPDALAYGNMVSLLVKAIQELTARLEALENK